MKLHRHPHSRMGSLLLDPCNSPLSRVQPYLRVIAVYPALLPVSPTLSGRHQGAP